MRIAHFSVSCLVIAGCATTADLKTRQDISEADRQLARTVAERITATCRYTLVAKGTSTREPEPIKFRQLAEIERLFRSNAGWYKADYSADGVKGQAYVILDGRAQQIVCGDELWNVLTRNRTVTFTEIGARLLN